MRPVLQSAVAESGTVSSSLSVRDVANINAMCDKATQTG